MLALKYDAGLSLTKTINTDNLLARLNNAEAKLLRHQISEGLVTLLNNHNQVLPIIQLENRKFASLSIGQSAQNEFTRYLSKYAPFNHFELTHAQDTTTLKNELADTDVVVVGVFVYHEALLSFLKTLSYCHFSKRLVNINKLLLLILAGQAI